MNELLNFTDTELLKFINDLKANHESLKQEIIDSTLEFDELEKKINSKIKELNEIEENHKILIEELRNRK